MVSVLKHRSFQALAHQVTPQGVYANRRAVLRSAAASSALALVAGGIPAAAFAQFAKKDPTAGLYPVTPNKFYDHVQGTDP